MRCSACATIIATLLALAVAGCSDDDRDRPASGVDGGGAADSCSYNGKVYNTGDVFCAVDGCNSCQCNPAGAVGVGCSMKDCSAPGVVVAGVCSGSGKKPLTACPKKPSGDPALKDGDPCPSKFADCARTSALCSENTTCQCVGGKVRCTSHSPANGTACWPFGAGRNCTHPAKSASDKAEYCTCNGTSFACTQETCPSSKPTPGSGCSHNTLLSCRYFLAKSQCDYQDMHSICSCTNGSWACLDEKEDCPRADSAAFAPDSGV